MSNETTVPEQPKHEAPLERTKGRTQRPLLNVPDPRAKREELLKMRGPFYAKADFHIDTTDLTVDEMVEKIVSLIKKEAGG